MGDHLLFIGLFLLYKTFLKFYHYISLLFIFISSCSFLFFRREFLNFRAEFRKRLPPSLIFNNSHIVCQSNQQFRMGTFEVLLRPYDSTHTRYIYSKLQVFICFYVVFNLFYINFILIFMLISFQFLELFFCVICVSFIIHVIYMLQITGIYKIE